MRRFFVPPEDFSTEDSVTISGDLFRHIAKVLRLKNGTQVILADGKGKEFLGVIKEIGRNNLAVTLQKNSTIPSTPKGPAITLYQGMPKGDKMELILQKTTELGVAEVIPFLADRSISRIGKKEESGKIIRWQRIVQEAARQSGRSSIPTVAIAKGLPEIVNSSEHSVKLLLWEEEKSNMLKETLFSLPKPETVAIIVGPEGGISSAEAAIAKESGFIPVSLGERILRSETAALAMLAILQFYWGDLG